MTFLAVALTLAATSAAAQERHDSGTDAPQFADVWIGGPLDSLYAAESARLQETCQPADTPCFAAELDTTAVTLIPVWSAPDGDPVGHLVSALRPRGRYPFATLLYRPEQGPDVVVREDVGDWGYGLTLPVAGRTEGWVGLRAPGATDPLWVPTDGERPGFGIVEVYGLAGRLWRLGPVPGTRADGASLTVPAGVYLVLEVADGTVRLRPEIPSDMPCGREPADPGAVPAADPGTVPEYTVPLDALTAPDGRPAVEPAYPKGC